MEQAKQEEQKGRKLNKKKDKKEGPYETVILE
jgi:hypothetical protein